MAMKIFTQVTCPKCPAAKALGEKLANSGIKIEYYDISEEDGLAEANMYMVRSTPSIVVVNEMEDEVQAWRGVVPTLQDVQAVIKNAALD